LTYAQERWAVVVGISDYAKSSYDINGSNDINIIVPMLIRNGFNRENILTLTEELATKHNIKNALYGLNIQEGDIVYFHFSGHGQNVTDINGDEPERKGGCYDQSLVTYNAQCYISSSYKGEEHIVDDELNDWLWDIKHKIGDAGQLIVVLDCCYSGTGSRGEDNETVRYIPGILELNIDNVVPRSKNANISHCIDWICISACEATERNIEYQHNGTSYGRLSYALSQLDSIFIEVERLQENLQTIYDDINPKGYKQHVSVDYN
jgi:hypothetical protein